MISDPVVATGVRNECCDSVSDRVSGRVDNRDANVLCPGGVRPIRGADILTIHNSSSLTSLCWPSRRLLYGVPGPTASPTSPSLDLRFGA